MLCPPMSQIWSATLLRPICMRWMKKSSMVSGVSAMPFALASFRSPPKSPSMSPFSNRSGLQPLESMLLR